MFLLETADKVNKKMVANTIFVAASSCKFNPFQQHFYKLDFKHVATYQTWISYYQRLSDFQNTILNIAIPQRNTEYSSKGH